MNKVAVIGGGYTGLAAAYELAKSGKKVVIYEKDSELGGLGGAFEIAPGVRLEKFYHHWFSSDLDILDFIKELGLSKNLKLCPSNSGFYFANSIFRLSSPWDLLSFTPIPLIDRIRTGLMALYARKLNNWDKLENITASEWIKSIAGLKSFDVVWAPMLQGKFGSAWKEISAVWFWNKLKLRGSSRKGAGEEKLVYYEGGFGSLVDSIEQALLELGVEIKKSTEANVSGTTVQVGELKEQYEQVLVTTPLPVFSKIVKNLPNEYVEKISQIKFLGNTCLILKLNRSLSDSYWLNVAEPSFPFVGVIEHTNIDDKSKYDNSHIAYLSKYLPVSEDLFSMNEEQFFEYAFPHLKKIFPDFERSWVEKVFLWKAEYSQPLVTKHYSKLIPEFKTPIENLWLCTMAQIYPEDRGTNYAVKYGRRVAKMMLSEAH